ncbi:MAG: DUF4149 domain-containing protein [Balneolaceae bacterium]|nr:DUF4149 domain-containing protein [Balneolaceae bacterium]
MYYYLSLFIHILCAMFWMGGMLFTVVVLVPVSRHKLFEGNRGTFFSVIGRKFSRASWAIFLILIVTGITNLISRSYSLQDLIQPTFWNSEFGNKLTIKLLLFALVLIISGIHDFYAGPKAAELMDQHADAPETKRSRRLTSWLGRINLLLGLGIIYYAIRLVRG